MSETQTPGTEPEAGLEPGMGAPLRPGPPASVSHPIDAQRVNLVFGLSGVAVICAVIAIVVIVGVAIISAVAHH